MLGLIACYQNKVNNKLIDENFVEMLIFDGILTSFSFKTKATFGLDYVQINTQTRFTYSAASNDPKMQNK